MAEWFEDESFWQTFYPLIFGAEKFAQAPAQVDHLLALTGSHRGQALDLCCGPGRHAVSLARKGFQVTAVDRSQFLLDKAKGYASAAGVEVEFIHDDMRTFVRHNTFDLVTNLFTSFGYFDNRSDDRRVLANIRDSLRPGGWLVLDVMSREWLAQVFSRTNSTHAADGSLFIQRHEILDDWTRQKNEWILLGSDDSVRRFQFTLQVYSGQELKELLQHVGFSEVRLYGDLDGRPYGPGLLRLVAVARKDQ